MSKQVYCIAEFKTTIENEDTLFNALMMLEPITIREEGCIYYTVTKQINSNFATGTSEYNIVLHERFKSKEDFEWHNSQDYISNFFNKYIAAEESKIVDKFNIRLFSDDYKHN